MSGEFPAVGPSVYRAACLTSGAVWETEQLLSIETRARLPNQTQLNMEKASGSPDNHRKASTMAGPTESWVLSPAHHRNLHRGVGTKKIK